MSNITLQVRDAPYVRFGDVGWKIPADGERYFMVRHEIDFLGTTRHADNNTKEPIPAVANKSEWGLITADNKDYIDITPPAQRFFYDFIDSMTGGLLPEGEFLGYYYIKNNPGLPFHDYTPGSRKWIYSRLYQDAVWATDAKSFTTGCRDEVLGLNLEKSLLWSYFSGRPCTGAILKLKKDLGSYLEFECLDISNLPDPYTLQPWQYYYCTQVFVGGRVTRFPQYTVAFKDRGWNYPIGTPSPLVAPGGWFRMKKNAVTEMLPGAVWMPYRN